MDTTLTVIAIVTALGLLGAVAVTVAVTIPLQQAEAARPLRWVPSHWTSR